MQSETISRRCSVRKVFAKFRFVTNFAKSTGKQLCQSCSPQTCNFMKKRLWHWCFLVNFAKFFQNTFFYRAPFAEAASVQLITFFTTTTIPYIRIVLMKYLVFFINPLHATDLFWYPWKPEVFWYFQGVSKEISDMKWVKHLVAFLKSA